MKGKRHHNMEVLAGMQEKLERRGNLMLALAAGSILKEIGLDKIEIHPDTMIDVANNYTVTIDTDPETNVQTFSIRAKEPDNS